MITRLMVLAFAILAAAAAPVHAQDSLVRAKDFYATAAYEEALVELAKLQNGDPAGSPAEVAAYQLYCLVALGRNDEARQAVQAIVRVDPLYHPPAADASPRVRAFFEEMRRPLLPGIVKELYGRAKQAFDIKDMHAAATGFDRVIALIDEDEGGPLSIGFSDVRTLAVGFRDLSKMAIAVAAPPPVPQPVAAAVAPPAPEVTMPAAPATIPIYDSSHADVKAPVAISRPMPPVAPLAAAAGRQRLSGVLLLVIGEDGKVLSANLPRPIHAVYNQQLLKATEDWRFTPASRNGTPVRYRLLMEIVVNP